MQLRTFPYPHRLQADIFYLEDWKNIQPDHVITNCARRTQGKYCLHLGAASVAIARPRQNRLIDQPMLRALSIHQCSRSISESPGRNTEGAAPPVLGPLPQPDATMDLYSP